MVAEADEGAFARVASLSIVSRHSRNVFPRLPRSRCIAVAPSQIGIAHQSCLDADVVGCSFDKFRCRDLVQKTPSWYDAGSRTGQLCRVLVSINLFDANPALPCHEPALLLFSQ